MNYKKGIKVKAKVKKTHKKNIISPNFSIGRRILRNSILFKKLTKVIEELLNLTPRPTKNYSIF